MTVRGVVALGAVGGIVGFALGYVARLILEKLDHFDHWTGQYR